MGICRYCGSSAGFLRSVHKDCERRFREEERQRRKAEERERAAVKEIVLKNLDKGIVSQRMERIGRLPFNLQKTEKLVWVFKEAEYFEIQSRTEFVGGSQGMSFRVAKGVSYRVGGFKGKRVQKSSTIHADTGLLGITDRHIYFAGPVKRFRIHYNKLVAIDPFEDGIILQRDAQTAKPQGFGNIDGVFAWDLVTRLSQI